MQIEGKRVLVTGASRGLGLALVFAFAEAGATEVIAGSRKEEDRNKLKTAAEKLGARIRPVQLDVTSDGDVETLVQLGG
ncbi:MAG TPA: SDR family NAD(P)-dependent oxidoreductase, partial [Pyrinomonadaceae bacterium]|nr:SDR family NAD(P)-dependent oxidoreductase [Pyrinomonadaceae bacterium]